MSSSERGGEGGKVIEFIADTNKTSSPLKNGNNRDITDVQNFRLKKEIENASIDALVKKARDFLQQHQSSTDISAMASTIENLTKKPFEVLVKTVRVLLMHPEGITPDTVLRAKAVMHAFILESVNQKNT
jgi:hypothetical protein